MADNADEPTAAEQIGRFYEQAESAAARAAERLVASGGFASLLGQSAENAAALTKLSADALDLVLRNLRLAGRRDLIRLTRQLARTEDKLERVLQEVEALRDQLETDSRMAPGRGAARARKPAADNGAAEPGPGQAAGRRR